MKSKIQKDLVYAIKQHDTVATSAIRAIKTAITQAETAPGASELDDTDIIKVIQKLEKQRIESASIYCEAGRPELAEIEEAEAKVMRVYLPAQMSDDELANTIKQYISELNATSIKDMGKVMAHANKSLAGKAESKRIADLVKSFLIN